MYEVREGQYLVNDVAVDTFRRNVYDEASVMEVEADTTGICGGEREEGGRTFIHIGNKFASDFFAELCRDKDGKVTGVNIAASVMMSSSVSSSVWILQARFSRTRRWGVED